MSKLFENFRPVLLDLKPLANLASRHLKLGAGSMFAAKHDENIAEVERFGL